MLKPQIAETQGIPETELTGIKNIIFDLGGVIIDIRYNDTIEQFKRLGFNNFETIYNLIKQNQIFDNLETGKIQPQAFRTELKKYQDHLTDTQIDLAWNAMIGEMPVNYIPLLKKIRQKYRTFLLSNTNAIHIDYFNRYLKKKFGYNPLPEMFEQTYYSHEMGCRKPDASAFEYVLKDAGLLASETLFIDDLEANIKAAQTLGIHTVHLVNQSIQTVFSK
jgi:glucose-1-phosphatase